MPSRRGVSAGAEYAFLMFYDSNGNPTGGTTTAPSSGTANEFDNILGVKAVPSTTPEPDTTPITGDDTLLGEIDFDSVASRRYTATVAAFDLDMIAQLQGTPVATLGDTVMVAEDVPNLTLPDTCAIICT